MTEHRPLVPLTLADLERIAEERGVRIDDLWPALSSEQPDEDDDEIEAAFTRRDRRPR